MAHNRHNNRRRIPSQPPGLAKHSYLERTSRPICAIAFLLPLIIIYELGTIRINSELLRQSHIRVVAFVWLQNFAEYLGLSGRLAWLATPLLVVVILLALQITSRTPWVVRLKDLLPMTGECLILAVPLIVFSVLLNRLPATHNDATAVNSAATKMALPLDSPLTSAQTSPASAVAHTALVPETTAKTGVLVNIVTGIGAGIYEEFVFRLILICLLMLLLQDMLGLSYRTSITLAVVIAALLFSAHHHLFLLNGRFVIGEAFSWPAFLFRTAAGLYFAALFALRGFGITAGTHAFHNVIAALLNAA